MSKSVAYFDSIAENFEDWINPFDLNTRLRWFDSQLDRFNLQGKLVLDVGCGLGHFSGLVAKRGGSPVCLDFAGKLLRKVNSKISRCVQADALSLPFKDNSFPFIISSECIEHTLEPLKAIKEMLRVLSPNGIVILSTPNYVWRWSIAVAEGLGIRKFEGIENFLPRREIYNVFIEAGAEILIAEGLHLFPFQLYPLHPIIRWFNKHGQALRGLMINQCWVARKAESGSNA